MPHWRCVLGWVGGWGDLCVFVQLCLLAALVSFVVSDV